jgi:hypothetical protein
MGEDEDSSRGSVERAIKAQHAIRLGTMLTHARVSRVAGIGETRLGGSAREPLGAGFARRLFVRSAAMGDMACP